VVGETTFEIVVVKAASLNQVNVPSEQFPASVLDSPEQIADGLAVTAVGAAGVVVTETETVVAGLLHVPFTQEA
jgi:hypothetical protein